MKIGVKILDRHFILFLILGLTGLTLSCLKGDTLSLMVQGKNRLGQEKSPYLLQHRDNPVHWYSWGEEAFQAAREENKPIFLSIGYSTCYWCHMMEKDSFEIQEVADVLNKNFISIKVDREEHPDVDQIYMDAVIGMTGRGGWPMSVFLTPDLRPFFGATFFWKAQFLELLGRVHETWEKEPDRIRQSGEQIFDYLRRKNEQSAGKEIKDTLLKEAQAQFESQFDRTHGGFGTAPKFPPSTGLSLLLRIDRRSGNPEALPMVTKTLDGMADGEIFDRIGGGFHRYATREDWNEPHYEKMLYDNALLALTYLEAYQVTQKKRYAEVVAQSLDYVLREMTDPEGGFYSAQDAGEVGKEGEYYHLSQEERARHEPPRKDDKILTSWNGLMIAALSKGYQVLGDARYLEAARKGAAFLQERLYKNGELLRRYRDGDVRFSGTLEDYAFLIHGLIHLFESDQDPRWIFWARDLQKKQDEIFWDNQQGGYFLSDPGDKNLVVRKKEYYDGAIPAGNSIAALNLLRFCHLFFEKSYEDRARELLKIIAGEAERFPSGYAQGLTAVDYLLDRPKEIVIVGRLDDPQRAAFKQFFQKEFLPNKVLAVGEPAGLDDLKSLPLFRGKTLKNNQTTIYVCENQTCRRPTNDLEVAKKLVAPFPSPP